MDPAVPSYAGYDRAPAMPLAARRAASAWAAALAGIRAPGATRRKLALYKPDGIGDLVLASGAIALLTARAGASETVLIVAEGSREAAASLFPGLDLVSVPAHGPRLLGTLRKLAQAKGRLARYRFDDLVCLRHSRTPLQELLLREITAGRSWGAGNLPLTIASRDLAALRFPFGTEVPYPDASPVCLELEAHARVVSAWLGEPVDAADLRPRLPAEAPSGEIVVTPHGSDPVRDYPPARWIEVFRSLRRAAAHPIVLTGGASELPRLDALERECAREGIPGISVAAGLPFAAFSARVRAARLVLTVETSTAHLATAADRPCVVLIGGGNYGLLGPWRHSEGQRWLAHSVPCFGCGWRCVQERPFCMTEIPPSDIVRESLSLL